MPGEIKLSNIINGSRNINYSLPKVKNTYSWAADEAGKMLEKLAGQAGSTIKAPVKTTTAKGSCYYLKGIEESIRTFQQAHGLRVNGQLTKETAQKLKEEYSKVSTQAAPVQEHPADPPSDMPVAPGQDSSALDPDTLAAEIPSDSPMKVDLPNIGSASLTDIQKTYLSLKMLAAQKVFAQALSNAGIEMTDSAKVKEFIASKNIPVSQEELNRIKSSPGFTGSDDDARSGVMIQKYLMSLIPKANIDFSKYPVLAAIDGLMKGTHTAEQEQLLTASAKTQDEKDALARLIAAKKKAPAPQVGPISGTGQEDKDIKSRINNKRINVAVAPQSADAPQLTEEQKKTQFETDEKLLDTHTTMKRGGVFTSDQEYYQNPQHYHEVVLGILNLPVNDQKAYLTGMSIEQMQPGTLGVTVQGEDGIHLNSDGLKEFSGNDHGIFRGADPGMVDSHPNRTLYPPQYTIAHEFAHLLTFNKWLGAEQAKYYPKMIALWNYYLKNCLNPAAREIWASRGSIRSMKDAVAIARKYMPSDYAASFAVQVLMARSPQEQRQIMKTGFFEFVAEMYAPTLLYNSHFKQDSQGKSYADAIPMIEELINSGGAQAATPESDQVYQQYKAATTS